MNIGLLMGRRGSKSIPGKNIWPILGRPLCLYPMLAAKSASKIHRVMVTTDCPEIQRLAREHSVEVIQRPEAISGDRSEMADGIVHALEVIGAPVQHLVTMHCNSAIHRAGLIDDCISRLEQEPEADSCVSGVIEKSVHPIRTRKLNPRGVLEPWFEIAPSASSNRQTMEPCVILDGAARAMRVASCFPIRGIQPFPYLGTTVLFAENPGGRDVHDEDDLVLVEKHLRAQGWSETSTPPHISQ
jgi:CMP-N-acetylneuraminic acid synthetase